MGRRLAGTVPIHQKDGTVKWYGPDDDVPADVAKKIGDHAWVEDDDSDEAPKSTPAKKAPAKKAAAKKAAPAKKAADKPADAGSDADGGAAGSDSVDAGDGSDD